VPIGAGGTPHGDAHEYEAASRVIATHETKRHASPPRVALT
jgi:hypothetical protein